MRSDAKLGLALGMLVIGFAIAFCFPREGRVSVVDQLLEQSLNAEEEQSFIPIRTLRDQELTEPSEEHLGAAETPIRVLIPEDQDLKQRSTSSVPIESDASETPENVSSQAGIGDLLGNKSSSKRAKSEDRSSPVPIENEQASLTGPVTSYRVLPGDTLSGIAMKTLGSYSRYLDIYNANRDRLNSPDDLRLGMMLVIPNDSAGDEPKTSESSTVTTEVLPEHLPQEEVPSPTPQKKRFQSPERTPFLSDRRTEMPLNQIQNVSGDIYVVRAGDSLEKIAIRIYGTSQGVRQLLQANPHLLENPNALHPGERLKLAR